MKRTILFIIGLFLGLGVMAQAPQAFRYQAVARDKSGNVLARQSVSFRITIKSGSAQGYEVYGETHSGLNTNAYGLVELMIGRGTPTLNDFRDIKWGSEAFFIKVDMDPAGGTNYEEISVSELLSVPYALYAERVLAPDDGDWTVAGGNVYRLTGNVGVGTNAPAGLLHLKGTGTGGGSFLAEGLYKETPGNPPASGAGTRMMWYPDKAAFRVGRVGDLQWDKDSIGNYSFATGYDNKALGPGSVAMGSYNEARTSGAFAIGLNNVSRGLNAVAMGMHSVSEGAGSVAMGLNALSGGQTSLAVGTRAEATGDISVAMGYGPRSTGLGAVSLGIGTVAPSYGEMAAGIFNTLYKPGSSTTREDADRLFVIGNGSFVSGDTLRSNALTILKNGNAGLGSDDPVAMLHVKGTKTNAGNVLFEGAFSATTPGAPPASGAGTRLVWYPGKAAFRAGNAQTTSWDQGNTGNYSTAMGNGSIASGEASVAIGSAPVASGGASVALGATTTAAGKYAFAAGLNSAADKDYAVALGNGAEAAGVASFSAGTGTLASGEGAVALGTGAEAAGNNSLATGYYSKALGSSAFAAGSQSVASEEYAVALGNKTTASGKYALSAGWNTNASRDGAVALGYYTFATGSTSFSMGEDTRAPSYGETVFGLYNTIYTPSSEVDWIAADRLFTVGNGISNVSRSNALTILKNGNAGLGTDTPGEKLHLKNASGSVKMRLESTDHSQIEFRDGSGFRGSVGFSSSEGHLYLYNGGNVAVKGGMLGVGTIDPTQKLDVDGNARIRSIGSGAYVGQVNRTADGTLTTATSDLRLKENVRTLQGGLEKILQMRGVTFTWKEQPGYGTRIGFIAQEVEPILPELVFTHAADGYKGVNYAEMSAVLVEAIKAQQALIETLQSENTKLKADMATLKNATERRLSVLEELLKTAGK